MRSQTRGERDLAGCGMRSLVDHRILATPVDRPVSPPGALVPRRQGADVKQAMRYVSIQKIERIARTPLVVYLLEDAAIAALSHPPERRRACASPPTSPTLSSSTR